MGSNEMCAILGRAHEFFLALKKAGFSDELIQEVINSKDNAMAKKMLESLQAKPTMPTIQAATSILSETISSCIVLTTMVDKFIAKDNFVVDTSKKAKVKISYLGDNFINWFLEKTEEPFPGSTVWGRNLEKDSVDGPILVELGGQEKAETTLFELFIMMKRQAKGENGRLLTNGYANIFYIRDINGILRAVSVYWYGSGWRVRAHSVEATNPWCADDRVWSRVPSRNSSDAQTC
jgi:hypothetical protein